MNFLDFEKPVQELLEQIEKVKQVGEKGKVDTKATVKELEGKILEARTEIAAKLTPWQKVQLSRHPNRPYTLDYISRIIDDFVELHGDRTFGDDAAVVAGLGKLAGRSVAIVGHQKGRAAKAKGQGNFGMPHPEGSRKALRLYEMASRFGLPILTFIDTPGAYPGVGAEERGQSEAIGSCLAAMSRARLPIVATIVGEGGSGGALALGVPNRVLVLGYGTYSVIPPEGCA